MAIDYVEEMLKAYFDGYANKEKTRQFNAQQAYNQDRLAQQIQEHQDEMARRAREFTADQAFKSADLLLRRQADIRATKKEIREERNQIRDDLRVFQEQGGYFMPQPQETQLNFNLGGVPAGEGIDPRLVTAPTPPVGPSQLQGLGYAPTAEGAGLATIQGLPMRPLPTVPMQTTVTPEAQMPSQEYAQLAPAMEGQPPGTIAMQKTKQQIALEGALGAYRAKHLDDIDVPDKVQEWFGGQLPNKLPLESIIKLSEARTKDLETRAARSDNNELKRELANQADETRRWLGLLMAQTKLKENEEYPLKVAAIIEDPIGSGQAYYTAMTAPGREKAMLEFKKHGLAVPRKLSSQSLNQQTAAYQLLNYGEDILKDVQDPELAQFYGSVDGRKALLGLEKIGDLPGLSPRLKEKIARAQGNFNTFMLMETRAALPGGRILQSVLDRMGNSTVRMNTVREIMEGHVKATKDNARAVLEGIEESVGQGWKDRPTFQDALHRQLNDLTLVKNFPAAQMDKMPEDQIVYVGGNKLLKKRKLRVGGDTTTNNANVQETPQFEVYKVD